VLEKLHQQHPKIYKHFFTVTTFSKLVALSMFIILPFAGFYLGMKYQEIKDISQENKINVISIPSANPNNANMANPASVYCKEQGGENRIVSASDGSQSGQCVFSDGRKCDEWQFFRTKICK
jgi:putative hemolysin